MEGCDAGLKFRVVRGRGQEYTDAPHAAGLLRACGEGEGRHRATDKPYELPTFHASTLRSGPWKTTLPQLHTIAQLKLSVCERNHTSNGCIGLAEDASDRGNRPCPQRGIIAAGFDFRNMS